VSVPTATVVVSRPAADGSALEPSAQGAVTHEPSLLARAFTEHPRMAGETYRQHGKIALGFALRLLGAGLACLIHAIVPYFFPRTGSATIDSLHQEMLARSLRQSRGLPPEKPPADAS
jgi:hypothetical protein